MAKGIAKRGDVVKHIVMRLQVIRNITYADFSLRVVGEVEPEIIFFSYIQFGFVNRSLRNSRVGLRITNTRINQTSFHDATIYRS